MIEFLTNDSMVFNMMNADNTLEKSREKSVITGIKPIFTIRKEEDLVKVCFANFSGDAVQIFCKRSSDEKFELIGETTEKEFTDVRPNLFKVPELREYTARFLKNNEFIGESSEIVLIIKK